MITLPPTPLFAIVESIHVSEPSVHVSEPTESYHGSPSSDETFTSHDDTAGISNYHAYYPAWVYTSHPSDECAQHNQNCPPTDPAKVKKYNGEKAIEILTVIGLVFAVFLVGFGIMLWVVG